MSGRCNKRSVRFYSVSERRRYEPSRSVTGSSTYEVRRCVFAANRRQADARAGAEILGVSVRTVRRWEDRFEADGAEGLPVALASWPTTVFQPIQLWRC
ncbi:helix-turn-helix domain-containing protein [Tateyamaria sp.]|uniref:helix-turn-helix domain-containing protein n=1 Tax=Tateyamaria sp. TaxID=1929288 RepID=UPI003B2223CF